MLNLLTMPNILTIMCLGVIVMPDYKKMYHILFNKIADVIDELEFVQRQTEKLYIAGEEQVIELNILKNKKEDSVSAIPPK